MYKIITLATIYYLILEGRWLEKSSWKKAAAHAKRLYSRILHHND